MANSISHIPSLVDAFVARVNREAREPECLDDVPEFLRETISDHAAYGTTSWHIVKRDNSARIANLQSRMGRTFPPSFLYLLANYCFPAFECGPLMFFANTGEGTPWELEKRLFADTHMSPFLLRAGFVQIGNPRFYNYDPVCFQSGGEGIESRIVRLDHEAVLQHGTMNIIEVIAPSFVELISTARLLR